MIEAELDPGACWLRHVKRAAAGAAGAVDVLAATFAAAPENGVNGRQGWQTAIPEVRLSDDGSLSVTFPNAAGEDGKLHRDRFAILTDPLYRAGEEWLELWREPDDLLIVATPVRWKLDRGTLVLECLDAPAKQRSSLSSESDLWVGAAPLDVLRFYAGAPVLQRAVDFNGYAGEAAPAGSGLTYTNTGASAAQDGIVVSDPEGDAGSSVRLDLPLGQVATDWLVEVRVRDGNRGPGVGGRLRIAAGGVTSAPRHDAIGNISGLAIGTGQTDRLTHAVPGLAVHRLLARDEWVYHYVNGELVAHGRRAALNTLASGVLIDIVNGGTAIRSIRVITQEPFLMADEPEDLRLPGTPPAGGLRARYYLEDDSRRAYGQNTGWRYAALSPFLEPYAERLEALNFATANPPAWQPPGPPSGLGFSVRWTGAIYLDLETDDRNLSFDMGGEDWGRGRVWIAGKLILDYSEVAGAPQIVNSPLRAILGERAGWYPICAELSHLSGGCGFILRDKPGADPASPTPQPIPISRLSPIGTVDRQVRNENHRDVFGDVAAGFGYQWRVEPRSLESGRFPGQITVAPRVGRDTNLIIDSLDGTDIGSEGDASEAIDGLVVDASGLATIEENAQLSYEAFSPATVGHLTYSAGYESLAEISELPLLLTRAESLLLLRSTPAESVGVRPKGGRPLVDRFPLPDTPELARMLWRPGDGVRLELDELAVRDATPRQLTLIQWPNTTPDGQGPPVVGFRQRGRGARAALERLIAAAYASRRNYQGQLSTINGSLGQSPAAAAGDTYSRMSVPPGKLLGVTLVVQWIAGTGATRTLNINGAAAGITITAAGRYPLPQAIVDTLGPRIYAQLLDPTASGGSSEFALEALVRL